MHCKEKNKSSREVVPNMKRGKELGSFRMHWTASIGTLVLEIKLNNEVQERHRTSDNTTTPSKLREIPS